MQGSVDKILYLKPELHKVVHKEKIKLRDAMDVGITVQDMYEALAEMVIYDFSKVGKNIVVFSILDIMKQIQQNYPGLTIENLGEKDFIIEYVPINKKKNVGEIARLTFIIILTFFGAAFTIMAFNNDISILGVFERFYMQMIGEEKPAVSELEICYSIGVALGVLVFFNHVGKKKITPDPTPIQVEMRKYEKDQSNTFIENEQRKGRQ